MNLFPVPYEEDVLGIDQQHILHFHTLQEEEGEEKTQVDWHRKCHEESRLLHQRGENVVSKTRRI